MSTAIIDTSVAGGNVVAAAPPNPQDIQVFSWTLSPVGGAASVVQFQDTGGAALSGKINFPASSPPLCAAYVPDGWFNSNPGLGVNLVKISGADVQGTVVYAKRGSTL